MEIAKTILEQIKAIDKMSLMAWGSKDFMATEKGLIFRVNGMTLKGWVKIELDEGADLYDLEFLNIRKRKVSEEKGIFFDQLVDVIDNHIEKVNGKLPNMIQAINEAL